MGYEDDDLVQRVAELLEQSSLNDPVLHRLRERVSQELVDAIVQRVPGSAWQPTDFATRLNRLFDTVHPPGRQPHTNAEVAAALTAAGHPIAKPYLSQLRSGRRTNPSDEMVMALAKFFKVKPDYFFNENYADRIDHDYELLASLQGYGLRRLSSRAFDLSEESADLLTAMAEKLRASEGLPRIPPDGTE